MENILHGSCACGTVNYEVRGPLLGAVTYCHCWRCRKHSGSSFGTTAGLKATDLTVMVPDGAPLGSWESSPGVRRYFASCCGSPLYKEDDARPEFVALRLGTLDDDPGRRVEVHYAVASRAPWVEIHDDLPQKSGDGPPFGRRE